MTDVPSSPVRQPSLPNVSHMLSPLYLFALAGLLLNDFILKKAAPGFITGKLSDFFGLFAFAVFWSAIFPRSVKVIHVAVGLAFVIWKLPTSDSLIHGWNAVMPLKISRVVDYSDLVALAVLPLSMAYLGRDRLAFPPRKVATVSVTLISLFAFAATSPPPLTETGKLQVRSGEYGRAISTLDDAIKQFPNNAEAYYWRGVARLNSGDTAGGEADIEKAISLDPKYRQSLKLQ